MARSIALGLYMLLAARGGQAPERERPRRPDGRLFWVHAGHGSRPESIKQILRLLVDERPELKLLVTIDPTNGHELSGLPAQALTDVLADDHIVPVRAFLDHWQPDVGLFTGASLPAALITEAYGRSIPLLLADAQVEADATPFWRRGMVGSLIGRFDRVLAQDAESVAALRALGGRALNVELAGRIEEAAEPLPYNDAERTDLADLLRARPVWLAVACPEAEETAVIEAHVHALSYAHRLLLILCPADADRVPALAERMTEAGLVVARRSHDEEPDPDVQVLITDGQTELGLWYRLAPVAFMGGTLSGVAGGRSPSEAAALGSALVHGPLTNSDPEAYDRLTAARATRLVSSADELCTAIADLIAPDKAASLAHSAWTATSGGVEVAERLVQIALGTLDSRLKPATVA